MKRHPGSTGAWAHIVQSGTSIVEALVALGLCGMVCAAAATMHGQAMFMVKANQQASASSLVLQERTERLRIANWRQITDSQYLRNKYFATAPASASALGDLKETIRVTAYPDESAATPIELTRVGDSVSVVTSGTTMANQQLARIDMSVEYVDQEGRTHRRETSTIMSKSGVSKFNLPFAGGVSDLDSSPTASPTASPDVSDSPTATPTATVSDSSGDSGSSSGNNGNGNGNGNSDKEGRGTVNGNSGKDK